ncbi:conserved hypothetical protein [uncultured Dysgonomonas sp.]|uniref:Winged helix-turn-helix domain-containing protein n=2 Tax=Dysgonomonas TaxID=156973 RepID=A0A840CVL0_9BACT|nr:MULTISPECIES: winged helix-turn-helix domain-containing protein [Dysgonomonas]MBB4036855.1 hypothetical protein [Dysgonomonas hofstadii]MBS5908171.1 winged helix-turn-helix domain-containing protein [Dysgonomonas mossii]SBV95523.1 conserved hypothetical protein [uncultured Dysgonomonas sp.]
MLKNDIGINAGVIWQILSEQEQLSLREIGELTNYKDVMIFYALGWLAREHKIRFLIREDITYVELVNSFNERYY